MRVTRLAVVLLVAGIVFLLCSVVLAQNKSQYRTGKLSKVEDATDLLDRTYKAGFLLLIQAGSDGYVAHYTVTYFDHVNKNLVAGNDVEFRISGKRDVAFSPAFPVGP